MITITNIAAVCHEANAALCRSLGDHSQVTWDQAPEWQQKSSIDGVTFLMENVDAYPSALHNKWCEGKYEDGWTYGPMKDATLKTHPCLIPFKHLPVEQRAKDVLFSSIVRSLMSLLDSSV